LEKLETWPQRGNESIGLAHFVYCGDLHKALAASISRQPV